MDIERELRRNLCACLDQEFETREEVSMLSADGSQIRADVVAIPRSSKFLKYAFAFEVKTASNRNFQKWTHVFRQAYDYVGATIQNGTWRNQQIVAAFVFPSPPYTPCSSILEESDYWRTNQASQLAGVIHMASMLKVGTAFLKKQSPGKGLSLSFGPNTLWNDRRGWFADGERLLSTHRVGSRHLRKSA